MCFSCHRLPSKSISITQMTQKMNHLNYYKSPRIVSTRFKKDIIIRVIFLFSSHHLFFTVTHKSLFSRYARHNRNHLSNLKTNLFVSRINLDNSALFDNNEKQGVNMRFLTPKINRSLAKKRAGKYSRLFSTFMNKNLKGL